MTILYKDQQLQEEKHLLPSDVYGTTRVAVGWIGDLFREQKILRIREVIIRPQEGVVLVDSIDGRVSVSGSVINNNTLCQRLGITYIGIG